MFMCAAALSAVASVAALLCTITMLAGDHALLQPIPADDGTLLPPPGNLPLAFWLLLVGVACFAGITAFFWLAWLVQSNALAKNAGATNMRFSPIMAAIWHFVPVMAYIMPMLVLVELEAATRNPAAWKDLPASRLAATTWLVAKLSAICFGASFGFTSDAATSAQYVLGLKLMSASLVLALGGLAITIVFMLHIKTLQDNLLAAQQAAVPS